MPRSLGFLSKDKNSFAKKSNLIKKKDYSYLKEFSKSTKTISKSKIIPKNVQSQFDSKPLPKRRSKKWNPFAHKSEIEVYGDEGLTLFDGNKLDDDDTGALFGFGDR